MRKIFTLILLGALFFIIGSDFKIQMPLPEERVVYQTVREQFNKTIEVPVWNIPEQKISVKGVGIYQNETTGEIITVDIILRGGNETIYIDIGKHAFGTDFQSILPLIKSYVEEYTNQTIKYKDIIIRLNASVKQIEGTSGSAAIAIGLIALLQNKTLVNDTIITGVLKKDGTLGKVQEVGIKTDIAKQNGIKKILIPEEQCNEVNKSAEIEIICVYSIEEALDYMIV
jgi:predicted ATP-dependent protease